MVKSIEKSRRALYVCESCGFAYADKAVAVQCEAYCEKHHACSLEITKRAV